MTVHPRERSVSIAASPVDEGADPPDWLNTRVPAAIPDATSDTNTLSMLVWVSAVFLNASVKFPPLTLSNSPAGIVVRLVQLSHAFSKFVPEDVSMSGKLIRLEQPYHVNVKSVPDDVSIRGKLVRLEHLYQVKRKLVPEDVSIRGKLVRLLHRNQAREKSVPEDVSIRGKLVSSDQPRQYCEKLVTAP